MFSQLYFHHCLHPLNLFRSLLIISLTISSSLSLSAPLIIPIAKPGCQSKCGNVVIPYPFGIGNESCAMDRSYTEPISSKTTRNGFNINCSTSSDPPKPFIIGSEEFSIEVLGISEAEIIVGAKITAVCYDQSGKKMVLRETRADAFFDLGFSSFTFSHSKNKLYLIGCDSSGSLWKTSPTGRIKECRSKCEGRDKVIEGSCTGHNGCCETDIPKDLKVFEVKVESFDNQTKQGQYTFSPADLLRLDNPANKIKSTVPVVLDWAIGDKTCAQAQEDLKTYACMENTKCEEALKPGYRCTCVPGYKGNPYLSPGCQDVNECEDENNPCYGICTNTIGGYSCSPCPEGTSGDGRTNGTSCAFVSKPLPPNDGFPNKSLPPEDGFPLIRVALGLSLGFLSVFVFGLLLHLWIRKQKLLKLKEKFFQQNGGLLLRQQLPSGDGVSTKIFTEAELKVATNNFHSSRVLGEGGHGTVYKGTLSDNRVVAIKKSNKIDQSQIEQFINEVIVLTQINHRNVVKLLGCCLETEVPLLVYEFVSNGTLSQHIHQKGAFEKSYMSWENRLRIATEIASAIAYLHSAASTPIIHRDIKSSNILLDDNYVAKVADFGASRLVP
ncbi:hypothetical protein MKX03_028051 [Papaver bracteatum]|nr:hypothetical protein MKX03_028051 [Papaver bracteatum]